MTESMKLNQHLQLKLKAVKDKAAAVIKIVDSRVEDGSLVDPLPKFLPYGITTIERDTCYGAYRADMGKWQGLTVIASVGIWDDRAWYHVSLARRDRLPNYNDLKMVKDTWIGKDRWAIQLFPEADKHVTTHNNCLHLWHCMDDFYLPDFRSNGEI
jgi:hypothetical protein